MDHRGSFTACSQPSGARYRSITLVKLTLLGLISWNSSTSALVHPWNLWGLQLESPLVLVVLAFWLMIIALANGLRLINVISALMKVYAPVAAVLLGATAVWSLLHLPAGAFADSTPTADRWWWPGVLEPGVFQLVFGYFAFAGLMGVEWGASSKPERHPARRLGLAFSHRGHSPSWPA